MSISLGVSHTQIEVGYPYECREAFCQIARVPFDERDEASQVVITFLGSTREEIKEMQASFREMVNDDSFIGLDVYGSRSLETSVASFLSAPSTLVMVAVMYLAF